MIDQWQPATDPRIRERLKSAYLALFMSSENLCRVSMSLLPVDAATVDEWFQTHEQQGVSYYAALEGDTIIGISVTQASALGGFELVGLAVDPDYRRRGIGFELIKKAITVAEEEGYRAVDLSVFTDNKEMLRLVIGLDFRPIRITHHARADGGDLLHLRRYL